MGDTWEFAAVSLDEGFVKENDMLLSIFLWQVHNHCYDASGCYEDLDKVFQKKFSDKDFREFIWTNVHGFLSESAMLSKILFPSNKKQFSKKRAAALLSLLNVESRELENLKSRKLRNRIEHMDEDLDNWWQSKKSTSKSWNQFAIKAIDGLDDDVIYAPNTELAFMYNPSTGVMDHLDEEYNIHGIFKNIVSVSENLNNAFAKLNQITGKILPRESR